MTAHDPLELPKTATQDERTSRSFVAPASLVVLALHVSVAFVLYRSSLPQAFESDAWVYLAELRRGFWPAATNAIGYHYQPMFIAWTALIRAGFGENAMAFQAINVIQLATLGWLTYHLGRRVQTSGPVAFLGGLLVIGSNAYYDATYWALGGNSLLLAGQFYVLAVIHAWDVGSGRSRVSGRWLLAVTILAAIFTHPAMTTALVVCPAVMFFAGGRTGESIHQAFARVFKDTWPLIGVVLLIALSRTTFASAVALGPQPGLDWMRLYWMVTRGIVAVFSLRGSHDVVHRLTMLHTEGSGPDTTWGHAFVLGWAVATGLIAVLGLLFTKARGFHALIVFFVVHLVSLTIAGGMASRQTYLLAVPASLLTAWAFNVAGQRLAQSSRGKTSRWLGEMVPVTGVLILMLWAVPDHVTSAQLHLQAAHLSRSLFQQIEAQSPHQAVLVNMPGYLIDRGIGAAVFSNGLNELARIASPSVESLRLASIALPGMPASMAFGTTPIEFEALRDLSADPSVLVLLFQPPGTITRLSPQLLTNLAGR